MRVAVVGLGAIAQKAYLPILAARADLELVLCTRDQATLARLSAAYRIRETAAQVADLAVMQVAAAFVHSATESHPAVVGALLDAGIDVYVDKPLAYTLAEATALVERAERGGRVLMVGFNRRFAPAYVALAAQPGLTMAIMQKNRLALPDVARRFVFDDYIHVVDTLRFLAPAPLDDVRISPLVRDGLLQAVMIQADGPGFACVGLMNRDSGATDESLEVMSPGNTWIVRNLHSTVHFAGGVERHSAPGDWETILQRRGFPQIIDHFLESVRRGAPLSGTLAARDSLATHALCERIVAASIPGAQR